jgi:predicted ATP-grasp superfamily ATP-dependent carboligase
MNRFQKEVKPGAIIVEGHVQGLSNTRSLGENGIPVFVIDKNNPVARYSKYCKKFFYCPDYLSEDFIPFLTQLAQKENLKGWTLIPSNDHAVYSLSRYKKELEQYYKVSSPDFDIVENIYDKVKLLAKAKECGIPVPLTFLFDNSGKLNTGELNFPLITKGRYGLSFYKATGSKVLLSENEEQLKQNFALINLYGIDNTFTQELIPSDGRNKTISFTAFCVDGIIKAHWTGVKLREHPIQFGTATCAESIYNQQCYKQSVTLLGSLKFSGVCEVEYLYDPRSGQYKLIEINARTWLWVGLAKACGVDYAKIIYNYHNSINIEYPDKYLTGIKWINYLTDFMFSVIALIKGKLNIRNYLSSFKGEKVFAVFSRKDMLPGLMFLFLSFYILRKRR